MEKRKQFDMNSPGAAELRAKIVHGAYKTEGQLVAFPLCFPSVSIPIRADESKITALTVTDDGVVYGGTSGYASHLFVAMFHGVTGMVLDLGVAEDCDQAAAVCCGKDTFFAAVNGPQGGRIVTRGLQETPFSLIQEWNIERTPFTYHKTPAAGERIIDAIATSDGSWVIGTTESTVFSFDLATERVESIGQADGNGRLAVLPDGTIIGRGSSNKIWRFNSKTNTLDTDWGKMPAGDWDCRTIWAADPVTGMLFTADAEANLFSFDSTHGFSKPLCRIPYSPVTSMAVTFDGRLFGSSGTDMQRMFCYDPADSSVVDIGVGASTLQQRRYCYSYGDAVTGRDGEIIFGEDDDLGHLWLYFPRIKSTR